MRKRGVLLGLAAGLFWGLDGALLGNYTGNAQNILYITLLTACFHDGAAALWIFCFHAKNKRLHEYMECVQSKYFWIVFVSSVLGGPVGMTANIAAINMSGAAYTCSITSAYPVIGFAAGIIFLGEHPRKSSIAGIVCAAAGAVVIGFPSNGSSAGKYFYPGILSAFGAALCWALEGVFSKHCMQHVSSDILVGIREIISCVTYVVLLAVISVLDQGALTGILSGRHHTVLILASLAGAFSYLCWYRAMDLCGVTAGMALNATYALWAAVIDMLLNHTKVSLSCFLGIVIILAGTVMTICSQSERKGNYE